MWLDVEIPGVWHFKQRSVAYPDFFSVLLCIDSLQAEKDNLEAQLIQIAARAEIDNKRLCKGNDTWYRFDRLRHP